MYIESFVATAENHTIEIPKEFYGKKIEVEIKENPVFNSIVEEPFLRYGSKPFDREAALNELRNNKYSLPPDYKFDRDEANER